MSQLLIFDLDGTLVDSRRDLAVAINRMRNHYCLGPLSLEVVSSYVGGGARNLVERALRHTAVNVDEALELYKAHYDTDLITHTTVYPGVVEGLQKLVDAGHQLAVLSNKPGDASRSILGHFRVDRCFKSVIGGGDIGKLKPHPDGITKLVSETGVDTSRTWMIGDHHTDLAAAKNAGVYSAYVEYGFGDSEGLEANARFSSFSQLVQFFI